MSGIGECPCTRLFRPRRNQKKAVRESRASVGPPSERMKVRNTDASRRESGPGRASQSLYSCRVHPHPKNGWLPVGTLEGQPGVAVPPIDPDVVLASFPRRREPERPGPSPWADRMEADRDADFVILRDEPIVGEADVIRHSERPIARLGMAGEHKWNRVGATRLQTGRRLRRDQSESLWRDPDGSDLSWLESVGFPNGCPIPRFEMEHALESGILLDPTVDLTCELLGIHVHVRDPQVVQDAGLTRLEKDPGPESFALPGRRVLGMCAVSESPDAGAGKEGSGKRHEGGLCLHHAGYIVAAEIGQDPIAFLDDRPERDSRGHVDRLAGPAGLHGRASPFLTDQIVIPRILRRAVDHPEADLDRRPERQRGHAGYPRHGEPARPRRAPTYELPGHSDSDADEHGRPHAAHQHEAQ